MEEAGESGSLHVPGHAEAPGRRRPVFISYASHDAPVAQKVCSALEAAGFLCWIAPRNVVPGTLYAEGIVRAIDESTIVVLILSKQGIASAHVGKELERATSKRHPIIALRTDAAVVPTFTIWDAALGKYRLRFDPAVELERTGDLEADIKANTQKLTSVIEDYVRKYPEQWLWVHRRWKTRPPGEKGLY